MAQRCGLGYLSADLLVGGNKVPKNTPITFYITPLGYDVTVISGDLKGTTFLLTVATADNCIVEVDNWNQYRR
jgi:hypothetical protein